MKKLTDGTKPAAKSILSMIAPPDIRKAVAILLPGETAEERSVATRCFSPCSTLGDIDRPILGTSQCR